VAALLRAPHRCTSKRSLPCARSVCGEEVLSRSPRQAMANVVRLPRGGLIVETALGPLQFGIPPETIKDHMVAKREVPTYYVLPTEAFMRRLGPTQGLNVAEFEFPTYFNFFVKRRRVNMIVATAEVEARIRRVFQARWRRRARVDTHCACVRARRRSTGARRGRWGAQETLFGPAEADVSCDYAPSVPVDARADMVRELAYFRCARGPLRGAPLEYAFALRGGVCASAAARVMAVGMQKIWRQGAHVGYAPPIHRV
jgi:hypothetical protein